MVVWDNPSRFWNTQELLNWSGTENRAKFKVTEIWINFLLYSDARFELHGPILTMSMYLNASIFCRMIAWLDFGVNKQLNNKVASEYICISLIRMLIQHYK